MIERLKTARKIIIAYRYSAWESVARSYSRNQKSFNANTPTTDLEKILKLIKEGNTV